MHVELASQPENGYLSPDEIGTAIQKLSETDILRLREIAKLYEWRCSLDLDDLLNEAIVTALSGNRRCPRNVPLMAFLPQAMRSIAANTRRKARTERRAEPVDGAPGNDPVLLVTDERLPPDGVVDDEREVEAIFALFENDEDVTMLLMGIYDGYNPDEICETTGWDRKTYATVRKRLRRRLKKHFPEGRQS